MSVVLGISNGHDACTALVVDGDVVVSLEKERFTKRKHDGGKLGSLLDATMSLAGMSLGDVDIAAVVPPIWPEGGCDWTCATDAIPRHVSEVRHAPITLHRHASQGFLVPHHYAHAAYAYLSSALESADVLTWDAGGYHCDATISTWVGNECTRLEPLEGFHLGTIWATAAKAIFGDMFAAGKVMGLAAYGDPANVQHMRSEWTSGRDLQIRVRSAWEHGGGLIASGTRWSDKGARDLAAALQALTTELGIELATALRSETGEDCLCISGGLALNGYTNSAISRDAGYSHIECPPAPHDGGLALGAALLAAADIGDLPSTRPSLTPYQGIRAVGGLGDSYENEVWREEAQDIAEMLLDGRVLGTCLGRAEHGPRALGNRSILAAIDQTYVVPLINSEVKRREAFRPLSPVLRSSDAHRFLTRARDCNQVMTQIGFLSTEGQRLLGNVAHTDGSVRAQLLPDGHPMLHVLDAIESLNGVPAIVNTSFNCNGRPIVNLDEDAIAAARSLRVTDLLLTDGLRHLD